RLHHTRNESLVRHVAETNPAQAELAIDGASSAAQPAAHTNSDLVARPQLDLLRVALVAFELLELTLELDVLGFRGHRDHSFVYASRNGMPNSRNSSRASSSLFVLVTKVTSMPWVKFVLSGS